VCIRASARIDPSVRFGEARPDISLPPLSPPVIKPVIGADVQ